MTRHAQGIPLIFLSAIAHGSAIDRPGLAAALFSTAATILYLNALRRTSVAPFGRRRENLYQHGQAHNHPSGDSRPLRGDIEMTKEVRKAVEALGVTIHDHLVIGRKGHARFKSLGLL